jgi:hypothetical protein
VLLAVQLHDGDDDAADPNPEIEPVLETVPKIFSRVGLDMK